MRRPSKKSLLIVLVLVAVMAAPVVAVGVMKRRAIMLRLGMLFGTHELRVDTGDAFTRVELPFNTLYLFDLGVTDIDADGDLDLYSTNHNARMSGVINDGGWRFREESSALGLDHTRGVRSTEVMIEGPPADTPGLDVFTLTSNELVLRATGLDGPISGEIDCLAPSTVTIEGDGRFERTVRESPKPLARETIAYTLGADATLRVGMPYLSTPITLTFDPSTDVSGVRVGHDRLPLSEHEVTLTLRDRHGAAWADFNDDGRPDVYITRGGLSGHLPDCPDVILDELFIRSGDGFTDEGPAYGIEKDGERARGATLVDIDGDGTLELHIQADLSADRLLRLAPDGGSSDVGESVGLALHDSRGSIWFDPDLDGDPDLVLVLDGSVQLMRNEGGRFTPEVLSASGPGPLTARSVRDFDNDGDEDVFMAVGGVATLLINEDGALRAATPSEIGLPDRAMTGAWVDVNNDGLADLFALPGGVYIQQEGGGFVASGMLATDSRIVDARSAWADLDGDGDLDGVVAVMSSPIRRIWTVVAYRNEHDPSRWVQIDLVGDRGNRPAYGARVVLETDDGERVASVGSFDSSLTSQGHARVYFTLPDGVEPTGVRVVWPDGRETEHDAPDVGARTVIERQG